MNLLTFGWVRCFSTWCFSVSKGWAAVGGSRPDCSAFQIQICKIGWNWRWLKIHLAVCERQYSYLCFQSNLPPQAMSISKWKRWWSFLFLCLQKFYFVHLIYPMFISLAELYVKMTVFVRCICAVGFEQTIDQLRLQFTRLLKWNNKHPQHPMQSTKSCLHYAGCI